MTSVRKGYLGLALQSLRASRLRSLMTMLGIVIGVMSVIVIVAIGQGVKEQIGNQSARYGSSVLLVRPDTAANILGGSGVSSGASALLSSTDLETLRRSSEVKNAVPLSTVRGAVKADHSVNNPLVIATTPELGELLHQKIEFGGFFMPSDGNNVAVLGKDIAQRLFNDSAPLGQKFSFRGQDFLVAGIFGTFSAAPFSLEANYNEAVFIPYTSAQAILGDAPQIHQVLVEAKPSADTNKLAATLQRAITDSHGGANDVAVLPPGSKHASSNQTLQLLTLMTIGMAVVALIVGGVGIMNMMLVSVTERIHEIGLRKAIGATNQQILRQFVTEAFALCVVGALLGLLVAFGAIGLLRLYTSLEPVVVWPVAIVAPIVAMLTGVFFGAIPALKAARMDPIEALRHE